MEVLRDIEREDAKAGGALPQDEAETAFNKSPL
jgi:hypothetical protein